VLRKSLLIALATLPGLVAYANLSDTVQVSCAHYGQPINRQGNTYVFRIGKWTIFEWANPDTGKIGAIEYMLNYRDTKIGEAGYNELTRENIPGSYASDSLWKMTDYRMDSVLNNWFSTSESKDGVYYIEYGKSYTTNRKHFTAYLFIAFTSCKEQAATQWHTEGDRR
jgi:hypothetical protein